MRTTAVLAFLLCVTTHLSAKDADTTHSRKYAIGKNEIGLFVEPFGNSSPEIYTVPIGIHYKRWTTPNLGYRILIAGGNYSNSTPEDVYKIQNDSTFKRSSSTNISLAFIGLGLEAQKQFTKRLILYAAFETKLGYGEGNQYYYDIVETATNTPFYRTYYYEQKTIASSSATMWAMDITPFIGAKLLVGKRMLLGTELTAFALNATQINYSDFPSSQSLANFSLGQLQQRFYINYRF